MQRNRQRREPHEDADSKVVNEAGMVVERCRTCLAPVVICRVHCSSCGERYDPEESRSLPLATNEVDEASIESFPASDPPGW